MDKINEFELLLESSDIKQSAYLNLYNEFKECFDLAKEWEEKAKTIIVTHEDQTEDILRARTGRLFLRDKRIMVEKKRKEIKEEHLKKCKAIDGMANILKSLIEPIEDYLMRQEKFVEIREKEKIRLENEKRIEEEKVENERICKLAIDREKKALPYKKYWPFETFDWGRISETYFNNLMEYIIKKDSDFQKEYSANILEVKKLNDEINKLLKNTLKLENDVKNILGSEIICPNCNHKFYKK